MRANCRLGYTLINAVKSMSVAAAPLKPCLADPCCLVVVQNMLRHPCGLRWPAASHGQAGLASVISPGSEMDTQAHMGDSSSLNERDYHRHADLTLGQLFSALEDVLDTHTLPDSDIEYGQGVLTCSLGDHGTYVINKQAPNKQIWASSPLSGPMRYDWQDGRWVYGRDGHDMHERLQAELRQMLGDDSISLEPEPVIGYGPDPT